MKIYNKLFNSPNAILLKALGVACGVILWIGLFFPLFATLFVSLSLVVRMDGTIGKIPIVLLFDSVFQSLACGISGILMSFVIIFISRSREIKTVVFAASIVAIFLIIFKFIHINFPQQSPVYKVYWLSDIILNIIFLFGFAVFGAWLFNRKYRL